MLLSMWKFRSWLFFVSFVLKFSDSKVVEGILTPHVLQNKWIYLGKFGFDKGRTLWEFSGTFQHSERFDHGNHYLVTYMDEEWPKVLAASTCEEKLSLARSKELLDARLQNNEADGWFVKARRTIHQHIRPHFWYFAWVDCTYGEGSPGMNESIAWNLRCYNPDESHFGVEQEGMWLVHLVILFAFCIGGTLYMVSLEGFRKKYGKSIPHVLYLIAGIFSMQILSVLFEFAHLTVYKFDGDGLVFFEFAGELCNVMGHVFTTTLFLMLSWGWNLQKLKLQQNSLVGQRLIIPGCSVVGLIVTLTCVHVIMAIFHQLEVWNDPHDIYHDHHTWSRLVEMVLRIIFWIWFVAGTYNSAKTTKHRMLEQQKKSQKLFQWLFLLISAWFLVLPIAIVIAVVIPEYRQSLVISCVTLSVQSVALIALPAFFLNPHVRHRFRSLTASLT